MNLDLLRRKRVKRLGIKTVAHTGQRRIFFILNRATKKFHGDVALWVQYIEYARQQKAYKKLTQIFSDALRLHPANADLWIYAAKYSLDDHADMTLARTYMQRGLRFCKNSKLLWIQYAKLELIYITKIALRRQILGLDQSSNDSAKEEAIDDPNAEMIPLPRITAEDVNPSLSKDDDVDHSALQNLQAAPVLSGAIPMAIFDAAMNQFNNDPAFGRDFFDMVLQFEEIPRLAKILEKVVEKLLATSPASHHARICHVRISTAGINIASSEFPRAFGSSLGRLRQYPLDSSLAQEVVKWLKPLAEIETLDPALRTVVAATLRHSERATQAPSR